DGVRVGGDGPAAANPQVRKIADVLDLRHERDGLSRGGARRRRRRGRGSRRRLGRWRRRRGRRRSRHVVVVTATACEKAYGEERREAKAAQDRFHGSLLTRPACVPAASGVDSGGAAVPRPRRRTALVPLFWGTFLHFASVAGVFLRTSRDDAHGV